MTVKSRIKDQHARSSSFKSKTQTHENEFHSIRNNSSIPSVSKTFSHSKILFNNIKKKVKSKKFQMKKTFWKKILWIEKKM